MPWRCATLVELFGRRRVEERPEGEEALRRAAARAQRYEAFGVAGDAEVVERRLLRYGAGGNG